MQTIDLSGNLVASKYSDTPDQWVSLHQYNRAQFEGQPYTEYYGQWVELRMYAKYTRRVERFSIFYQGPGGACRTEQHGPMIQGPHGSLSAQATVIANSPVAQARYLDVEEGDVLVLNGQRMVIVDDRPRTDYPRLVTELEAGMIRAADTLRLKMVDLMAEENRAATEQDAAKYRDQWMFVSTMIREVTSLAAELRAAYQPQK